MKRVVSANARNVSGLTEAADSATAPGSRRSATASAGKTRRVTHFDSIAALASPHIELAVPFDHWRAEFQHPNWSGRAELALLQAEEIALAAIGAPEPIAQLREFTPRQTQAQNWIDSAPDHKRRRLLGWRREFVELVVEKAFDGAFDDFDLSAQQGRETPAMAARGDETQASTADPARASLAALIPPVVGPATSPRDGAAVIERRLDGNGHFQLELALAPTPRALFEAPRVCELCGRWGYHLVGCANARSV